MNEIDVNEIFQKLRNKSDIKNFFHEQALYFPDGYQFGKSFVLNVLNGRKKILPLGCYGGLNFLYYNKNKKLVKEHIFKEFENDENLL